jgi:exopolysaccharide biosynthesis polyprenyl glycosylphosphotransferase
MDQRRIFFVLIQILDLCLATLTFFHLFSLSNTGFIPNLPPVQEQLWILPMILLITHVIFFSFGLYEFEKRNFFAKPAWYAIPAAALSGFLSAAMMYLFKNQLSRVFFVTHFTYLAGLVMLMRWGIAHLYRGSQEGRDKNGRHNVLIIGATMLASRLVQVMEANPEFDGNIIGFIDIDKSATGQMFENKPIIGSIDQLEEILRRTAVDEAVFCIKQGWEGGLDKYFMICEEMGVTVRVVADFFNLMLSRTQLDDYYGVPLLTFQSTPDRTFELFIKRVMDIVVAGVGLIVLMPMFIAFALAIKIYDPGPILFAQERVGLNKRRFQFYKFRTMVVNAEALKEELMQHNELDGPAFKMKNDPRITALGRLLRKYSLDEFPQFWNVLVGDMSLVGPRPPVPKEVEKYDRWQLRRLSMRPGLTCIWQVSGRNDIGFLDWMKMDLFYIDNWSLWTDLKILVQTIPAVIMGRGAS